MARQYGASGRGGRKKSTAQLKADNRGVKHGTIRKGKGGKTVRKYNANTGRWEILRVIDKKGRTKKTKTKTETSYNPDSGTTRPGNKNLGLGGSAAPYKRPGRRPAQEKVVNVKIDPKDARGARTGAALRARESAKSPKKIPTGRVVMRGNPPKKYIWNGERFERYTGPRPPSPGGF